MAVTKMSRSRFILLEIFGCFGIFFSKFTSVAFVGPRKLDFPRGKRKQAQENFCEILWTGRRMEVLFCPQIRA
jgi:hypothetical protein